MNRRDKREKIRRWEIPGEKKEKLLVATGQKRGGCIPIVIKALQWIDKHLTMSLKDDGTFNIHMTKEGNIPEHTKLAKGSLDLEKLKKNAKKIYERSRRPINPQLQKFQDFVVLSPRKPSDWDRFYWRLYEIKKRKLIYPDAAKMKEMENDLEDYFDVLYMDELPESPKFLAGIYSDQAGKKFGLILSDKDEYFMIPISEMMKTLIDCFRIEFIWCPKCGTQLSKAAQLCPKCGIVFEATKNPSRHH
jgi:hypothetical protein